LIAAAGAALALLSPIGLVLAAVGVALMLLGTVVAAPYASSRGPLVEEWWTPLALASLLCLVGFSAEIFLPFIGGVLLTVGGVAALVVVGLSTPPRA
jgi:hypothetical protein